MNPVALVLLEAEITDALVSRARQAFEASGQPEPTEPGQFRAFLVTLVDELQRRGQYGSPRQRLQGYDERLGQLGVELEDVVYCLPASSTVHMAVAA